MLIEWGIKVGKGALSFFIIFYVNGLAVAEDGGWSSGRMDEAQIQIRKKNWAEAAVVLRSILEDNRNDVAATIELARTYFYLGRREDAFELLNEASYRAKSVAKKQWIARIQVMARLFEKNENFQEFQSGLDLMKVGQIEAASTKLEAVLKKESNHVEVLMRLGQCHLLLGDPDTASERLRLAYRLNPYSPEIRLWLGRAFHQRGELGPALIELEGAQKELKDLDYAAVWVAEAFIQQGKKTEALIFLEKHIDHHPNAIQSLVMRAQLLLEKKGASSEELWEAKKNLRLALSRMAQVVEPEREIFVRVGSSYIFQPYKKESIQKESQTLLERVEANQAGAAVESKH